MNEFTIFGGNIWDVVTAVSGLIMAGAAGVAVVSYKVSRKSQYLSTIESCSEEYRGYMRQIQNAYYPNTVKRDLLGLFHKQLFYIKNNYVPIDIKVEWIKTMHKVLSENVLHSDPNNQFNETFDAKDWKQSFDRVKEFMCKKHTLNVGSTINDEIRKHYKNNYFTKRERRSLKKNERWKRLLA